ncbi:MAG: hypothetical protein JKY56_08185 [Kofleriaceae bacterium]|nr:hypothetical protein [Kofleriaceae bacterium]
MWKTSSLPVSLLIPLLFSCTSPQAERGTLPESETTDFAQTDVFVTVDILDADEGLVYWLRLRASDSCAVWTSETSDGAEDSRHQCEICSDSVWVSHWRLEFRELRSAIAWVSENEPLNEEYLRIFNANNERIWLSIGPLRPRSHIDYKKARRVTATMWQEAYARMPTWENCRRLPPIED